MCSSPDRDEDRARPSRYQRVVLQLRVFGAEDVIAEVAGQLTEIPGSRHVIVTGDRGSGKTLVTADVADEAVDRAL